MNYSELDDKTILQQVMIHDRESYREIVKRYQGRVFACARAITGRDEDASDVTQEVFIRFYRNIEQFDSERPLLPYLLKISVNTSRNLIRKRNYAEFSLDDELYKDFNLETESTEKTPLDGVLHQEKIQKIRDMVGELPQMLREVCSLFYLSECSCTEVAGILKISENSVKVALHRARKKLISDFLAQRRAAE
jgi:RNA polymerase sigma-70 factor (ECF subfamily)